MSEDRHDEDTGREDGDDAGREDGDEDDGDEDEGASDDELSRLKRTAEARKAEVKRLRRELAEARNGKLKDENDKDDPAAERERRSAEREQAAARRIVATEVAAELRATGLDRQMAREVVGMIDLSGIELDEDDRVDPDDVAELVEKLRRAFGGTQRESRGGGRVERRERQSGGKRNPDEAHSEALMRSARR